MAGSHNLVITQSVVVFQWRLLKIDHALGIVRAKE